MNQTVGKGQVGQRIFVYAVVKIIVIGGKCPFQSVMQIEHAGDTVKPKTVKSKFVQPVPAIGDQKCGDLGLTVRELGRYTFKPSFSVDTVDFLDAVDEIVDWTKLTYETCVGVEPQDNRECFICSAGGITDKTQRTEPLSRGY